MHKKIYVYTPNYEFWNTLKNCFNISHRFMYPVMHPRGWTVCIKLLGRNMKKQFVLSGDNIGYTITIIRHRSKTTAGTDELRVFFKVHYVGLLLWCLASGQAPWLTKNLVLVNNSSEIVMLFKMQIIHNVNIINLSFSNHNDIMDVV